MMFGVTPEDVRPYDVYELVLWNAYIIYILIGVMMVHTVAILGQIYAKVVIYRKVMTLLTVNEQHAQVTDSRNDRVLRAVEGVKVDAKEAATVAAQVAKQSAAEVKVEIEEVKRVVMEDAPPKIVQEIKKEKITTDNNPPSGTHPTQGGQT